MSPSTTATATNAFAPEGEGSFTAINGLPEVTFPLRYPGQVEDPETGLFYNHHRYYDPYLTVGYTQADPIGLGGGIGLDMWGGIHFYMLTRVVYGGLRSIASGYCGL